MVTYSRPTTYYCPQLQPFLTASRQMSTMLRTFTETCYIDSLCPDLTTHFTRGNQTSINFLNQANAMLNSVRPSRPSKGTSGLFKVSQLLIGEWIDLVTTFNCVVGQGLTPHFQLFV
jgi:hypothetical protein